MKQRSHSNVTIRTDISVPAIGAGGRLEDSIQLLVSWLAVCSAEVKNAQYTIQGEVLHADDLLWVEKSRYGFGIFYTPSESWGNLRATLPYGIVVSRKNNRRVAWNYMEDAKIPQYFYHDQTFTSDVLTKIIKDGVVTLKAYDWEEVR
jgi:hypothetical protein